MTTPTIASVGTAMHRIPLRRPWGPDVTDVRVIAVTVTASDGASGYGFSWTPTIGSEAVRAVLDHDLAPFVVGLPAEPEIWDTVWARLHEAGGSGITTIALAGLDLALWDLAARRDGRSITEHLGARHESLPVYGSGVNLHYSLPELVAQAGRWVAAGCVGVKIKVGQPDLVDDLERIAAVRDVIGPSRLLMVDANQRWDLPTATRAAAAFEGLGLAWLEEPLRAEDLASHVTLRERTSVPIAVGENLHTAARFAEYLDAGGADIVQPNIVRVGGITPFLRIARLAEERGVPLHPHLLPELSAQVALALGAESLIEDVEDAGFAQLGALDASSPVSIEHGAVRSAGLPGLGMRFATPPTTDPEEAP